jgi:hypothetical protein
VLEITNRAQREIARPDHNLMAEQPVAINHQVGQQRRSTNKQFGQQRRSINQQFGQQQQSMNQQIGQQAQPPSAAVRQENAQQWSPAGNVWYPASSPPCGGGLRRLHLLRWGRFDTLGNAFS